MDGRGEENPTGEAWLTPPFHPDTRTPPGTGLIKAPIEGGEFFEPIRAGFPLQGMEGHELTMKTLPTRSGIRSLDSRALAVALALLATALAGCDIARSRQVVGRKPADLDQRQLAGTWRDSEGRAYFLRVADAADARLELATVETNERGFQLNHMDIVLREQDEVLLVSLRATGPKPEEDYAFGRVVHSEGALVLHLASAGAIRQMALDGILGAEVTTNSGSGESARHGVIVTNGFDRLAAALAAPTGHSLLDTANPILLIRQKRGHD